MLPLIETIKAVRSSAKVCTLWLLRVRLNLWVLVYQISIQLRAFN